MYERKYNRSEILKLIELYRQHECLWKYDSPYYKRKDLKRAAYDKIGRKFHTSAEDVKKKIRNLRNTYIQERKKVLASHDSGDTNKYEPSLSWYNNMSFINASLYLRRIFPNIQEVILDDENCDTIKNIDNDHDHIIAEEEDPIQLNSTEDVAFEIQNVENLISKRQKTYTMKKKRNCKISYKTHRSILINAIKIMSKSTDEFQIFGDYVASELRSLSSASDQKKMKRMIQRIILQITGQDDN